MQIFSYCHWYLNLSNDAIHFMQYCEAFEGSTSSRFLNIIVMSLLLEYYMYIMHNVVNMSKIDAVQWGAQNVVAMWGLCCPLVYLVGMEWLHSCRAYIGPCILYKGRRLRLIFLYVMHSDWTQLGCTWPFGSLFYLQILSYIKFKVIDFGQQVFIKMCSLCNTLVHLAGVPAILGVFLRL